MPSPRATSLPSARRRRPHRFRSPSGRASPSPSPSASPSSSAACPPPSSTSPAAPPFCASDQGDRLLWPPRDRLHWLGPEMSAFLRHHLTVAVFGGAAAVMAAFALRPGRPLRPTRLEPPTH